MTEDDYFDPMPTVHELAGIFHLTAPDAEKLWAAIKERRFKIFEKVKQRRKQNQNQEQRQIEPEKKEDDWLFELLILLIILRQKQRLELNHNLIMSLINITKQIDESNEMKYETKPESKPKL